MESIWITTFFHTDGLIRTHSVSHQKNILIHILNHHQLRANDVTYLQVRSQYDAFHNYSIETWSADITGFQRLAPSPPLSDSLKFGIEKYKKRGIKLPTWLNPYRVMSSINHITSFTTNTILRSQSDGLLESGNLRMLNRTSPNVRDYKREIKIII
nr:hypothetical protein [Pedobacter glucosidilyticus]